MLLRLLLLTYFLFSFSARLYSQELNARLTINHQMVEGSSTSVFETLEETLNQFLNEKRWTEMQFSRNERINCTFNITIHSYSNAENTFECSLFIQSTRPVYGSNYTSTTFANNDNDFNFTYQEHDQLDFRADLIENNLTSVLAYYVYLIIGIDMDTMSPMGGTEYLKIAQSIVNNAQGLPGKGWKAFDDERNRYAIIYDMLDGSMEPFRQMQYTYYRQGLDVMQENIERGRDGITQSIGLLKQAKENKSLSMLPQIFTEYKRDELVSIYKGHGTPNEKEEIIETLSNINPSQNSFWRKMKD